MAQSLERDLWDMCCGTCPASACDGSNVTREGNGEPQRTHHMNHASTASTVKPTNPPSAPPIMGPRSSGALLLPLPSGPLVGGGAVTQVGGSVEV